MNNLLPVYNFSACFSNFTVRGPPRQPVRPPTAVPCAPFYPYKRPDTLYDTADSASGFLAYGDGPMAEPQRDVPLSGPAASLPPTRPPPPKNLYPDATEEENGGLQESPRPANVRSFRVIHYKDVTVPVPVRKYVFQSSCVVFGSGRCSEPEPKGRLRDIPDLLYILFGALVHIPFILFSNAHAFCSQMSLQNYQPSSPPDRRSAPPQQPQPFKYAPQMAQQQMPMPFGSAQPEAPAYVGAAPQWPAYPYNNLQGVPSQPAAAGPYPFAIAGQPPPNLQAPPPIPNAPPVGEPPAVAPSIAKVQMPGAKELMQVGDDPRRMLRRTSNKRTSVCSQVNTCTFQFSSISLRIDSYSIGVHIRYSILILRRCRIVCGDTNQ